MSTQKYDRVAIVTLQDNTSSALASGARAFAATTSPYANDSNLNFWGDIELAVTYGTAPTAGKLLQVYAVPTLDGTNYADGDSSVAPDVGLRIGAVAVRNVTSAQRLVIRNCLLPPHSIKLLLENGADQQISSAWTMKIVAFRTQSV